MNFRLVPMDRSHLPQVLAIERASFAHPWTEEQLVEDLYNDLISLVAAEGEEVLPPPGAAGAAEARPPWGPAHRRPGRSGYIGYTWPSPRLVRNFFPTWISRAAFTARSTLSRRSGFRKGRRA